MMMTSDPIADMLTRIRNANTAKHDTVDIPSSKMKKSSQVSRESPNRVFVYMQTKTRFRKFWVV